MDKISEERIKLLHPLIRDDVTNVLKDCDNKNIKIRITQGFRTIEEQDKLYAQGRTMPGQVVTNSRGSQSWHNYGLAFDFCLINPDTSMNWDDNNPNWQKVVDIAKNHEFEWGGDWLHPDYCHFQNRFGLSIENAYKLMVDGNVNAQGFINIIRT